MKVTSLIKLLSLVFLLAMVSCGDEDPKVEFAGSWAGTLSGCDIEIGAPEPYTIPDLPMDFTFANSSTENVLDVTVASSFFTSVNTTASVDGSSITIEPFTIELAAGPSTLAMTMSGPGTLEDDTINVDTKIEAAGSETNCDLALLRS